MLFEIDSSIKNIDPSNQSHADGIETLLSTYRKQNHVIFMRLADVPILVKKIGHLLSAGSRLALTSLYNNLPEYKKLSEKVNRKVIVYVEDEKKNGILRQGMTWHVPIQKFSSLNIVESALIGEDSSDAEILLEFAEHYLADEDFKNFVAKARTLNGGGANTNKTLISYLKKEHSPCLCVTDSDKFHPKFRESSTTKKCRNTASQHPNHLVEHFELSEREMENLIPRDLLKKVAKQGGGFFKTVESEIISTDEHWKYVDMKNGASSKWINKQDAPTLKYWVKASKFFNRRIASCPFCGSTGQIDEETQCECSYIPGLGNSILTDVISYIQQQKTSLTLREMKNDLRWKAIARIVFEYSVAPKMNERVRQV